VWTLVRSQSVALLQPKVTIGGVVQPGMDLLEIVPLEGGLLVEDMYALRTLPFTSGPGCAGQADSLRLHNLRRVAR
jgi:hypothetical protein